MYLSDGKDWLAVTVREVHIVNNLKIKILIDIKILILKNILLLLFSQKAIVKSCDDIKILLTIIIRLTDSVWKTILTHKNTIIQLRSHINILIVKTVLFWNYDLLFKLNCHTENTVIYIYIVNYTLSAIQIQNDLNIFLIIL